MSGQEYVDSFGRVPRGIADISAAHLLRFILLMRLVQQLGGKVEIERLGTPEEISGLMHDYELKVSGSGHGSIIVEVVHK